MSAYVLGGVSPYLKKILHTPSVSAGRIVCSPGLDTFAFVESMNMVLT